MLQDAAEQLGITEQEVFEQATLEFKDFALNPQKAWEYYLKTGYIPYFVTDYCKEVINGEQSAPQET